MQSIKVSTHYAIGGREEVSQHGASTLLSRHFVKTDPAPRRAYGALRMRMRSDAHPEHCVCTSRGSAVPAYFRAGRYRELGPGGQGRSASCVTLGHGRARCVRRERRELGRLLRRQERTLLSGRRAGRKGMSMSAGPWLVGSSSLSAAPRRLLGSLRTV